MASLSNHIFMKNSPRGKKEMKMMSGHSRFHLNEAVIVVDARFGRVGDDILRCGTFGHPDYWKGYLEVFSKIYVVARSCTMLPLLPQSAKAENVEFILINDFGISNVLSTIRTLGNLSRNQNIRRLFSTHVVFYRYPSFLATLLDIIFAPEFYAVEVVGDPAESLHKSTGNPWWVHQFVRPFVVAYMKKVIRRAVAVSYVTKRVLQRRYPAKSALQAWYSTVILKDLSNIPIHASSKNTSSSIRMAYVGFLVRHKGLDILLQALSKIRGHDWRLFVFGKGQEETTLRELAKHLKIDSRISWEGFLPRDILMEDLKKCDLFILPSKGGEGTPRALLEAMSVGVLPIASNVGGVREVLPTELIFPPNDVAALYQRILYAISLLQDRAKLQNIQEQLWAIVREYSYDRMLTRRIEFYSRVQEQVHRLISEGRR